MTSPLSDTGSNFPCKGYLGQAGAHVTASFVAGQPANFSLVGSATHGGGSCQISLSYDNGKTFKVVESILGGCPLTSAYTFQMPSGLPSGNSVVFSWSWMNKIGNREFYQNCALVNIQGSGSQANLAALPDMQVANVGTGCTTVEGIEVIPLNPGTNVQYGGDYAAGASAVNGNFGAGLTGNCGSNVGSALTTANVRPQLATTAPTSTTTISQAAATTSQTSVSAAATATTQAVAPAATGTCTGSSIACTGNGYTWSLCSNGQYVPMGAVAPGTICVNGAMAVAPAGNVATVASTTTTVKAARPVLAVPTKLTTTTAAPVTPTPACVNKRDLRPVCKDFELKCSSDGRAYQICSSGAWSASRSLATSEECFEGAVLKSNTRWQLQTDIVATVEPRIYCSGTGLSCSADGRFYYICDSETTLSTPTGSKCIETENGGGFVTWQT